MAYALTPFLAWLVAGCLKFIFNWMKSGKEAFSLIGYGGFPSTHTTIVISTATLIGIKNGLNHPAFGIATTLAFIVMLDASSLRRQIGKQAEAINRIAQQPNLSPLRERIGHRPHEIVGGILTGIATGTLAAWLMY